MLDQNTDRSINMIGVILLAGAIMLVILGFVPDVINSLASTADGVDVIYELDGGSSKMEKRHLGLKGEHTIPLEEPIIESYHFAGWENSTTGEIQFPGETFTPKQHTTMTATWRVRQHDIEYDANGGQGEYPLQRVDFFNTYKLYPNEPVLEGHTFRGWHNSHTGGTNYPNQTITPDGDILFTANWTLNSYPVTYHLNNGSGSFANTEIDHFAQFNISNTKPTRTGYTFTGWLVQSDDPAVSNVTKQPGQSIEITGRTRLTAQWSINSYNITYDLSGGVGTSTGSTVVYNNSYKLHTAAPTRVGYTFQGWKRSDTGTVINPGATFAMPANNVKLTAQWTINKYNVAYAVNGGSGSYTTASIDYNVNHTISSTTPTRVGYTFKGWRRSDTKEIISQGVTFKMPANHVTLTAQWDINSYQVIYNLNGGSGSFSNNTLNYNSLYTVHATIPTRTGHTFTGWKRSDTGAVIQNSAQFRIPANNVKLTAQWSINGYNVTYDRNGGTSGPSGTTRHNYGTTFSINATAPARTGYLFNGWIRSDTNGIVQPGGSFSVPSRNVTLTAEWKINTHTVTYNTNGGSGSFSSSTHNYGANHTVSGSKPTRTHFTFTNWSRSGSGGGTVNPGNSFSVTGNTTLTANWSRNTSTVSYNANGGTGAPGSQTKQHGINLTLSGTKPTRAGYTFLGWNTNSAGTGTNYSSGGSYTANSNVTLYARWSANSYSVTYDKSSATGGPSNTSATYTSTFRINKSSIPKMSGHVFAGWRRSDDSRYYNPNATFSMPRTNITLTARFRGSGYLKVGSRIKIRAGATYMSNSVGERGRTIPETHTVGRVSYVLAFDKHGTNSVTFGDSTSGSGTGAVHRDDIILQDPDITLYGMAIPIQEPMRLMSSPMDLYESILTTIMLSSKFDDVVGY